ncbi:hypothetical protein BDB01DRAFT_768934 [Pilobolus umbonatus]|nr:hypothetical protein BDB01DRAFT_768934 [Pilobolus umbonatus]
MPPSSPPNRKLSNPNPSRNQLVERCASLRKCEPCKRRKRVCNGQRPCSHCVEGAQDCVYSVVSDHPRSVFSTNTARRLSSGSACETCRRRKTKCDGSSPCGFCASNGIECVNNSERRKRSMAAPVPITSTPPASGDHEAMDRIEDRLRRIEKLMTAFTPSPLSQSSTASALQEIEDIKRVALNYRKLSSPHIPKIPASVRQHRHSIQGLTDDLERRAANYPTYKSFHDSLSPPLSPPPPLSPGILRQSTSLHTNSMASSMLNLSLSPSSSSTSSNSSLLPMQPSSSTPTSPLADVHTPLHDMNIDPLTKSNNLNNNNNSNNNHTINSNHPHSSTSNNTRSEWKQPTPIPSLMDQLSKCTFVTTVTDYTTVHYPIYPIPPNHPEPPS